MIEIIQGDITKIKVDAIVNAANTSLLGGGGVDGAIHHAAGKGLLEECKLLNGCNTGEAKITKGYGLPAKYVIHTVGPVWKDGNQDEDYYLANCYINSLKLTEKYNIQSIAFPAISIGIYGFPLERATLIALTETKKYLKSNKKLQVLYVCFDKQTYNTYQYFYTEMI